VTIDWPRIGEVWKNLSPWVQGLFGGAGVTLVWEALLKPRREKRSLARALAEEVAINLQLAAAQHSINQQSSKAIPGDFSFQTAVYHALIARLGELPDLDVARLVGLYAKMDGINKIPPEYAQLIEEWRALPRRGAAPLESETSARVKRDLDRAILIFGEGVANVLTLANEILPRLRRASVPLWRLDYIIRRKTYLDMSQVHQDMSRRLQYLGDKK
jgi:hypothetical protein